MENYVRFPYFFLLIFLSYIIRKSEEPHSVIEYLMKTRIDCNYLLLCTDMCTKDVVCNFIIQYIFGELWVGGMGMLRLVSGQGH